MISNISGKIKNNYINNKLTAYTVNFQILGPIQFGYIMDLWSMLLVNIKKYKYSLI